MVPTPNPITAVCTRAPVPVRSQLPLSSLSQSDTNCFSHSEPCPVPSSATDCCSHSEPNLCCLHMSTCSDFKTCFGPRLGHHLLLPFRTVSSSATGCCFHSEANCCSHSEPDHCRLHMSACSDFKNLVQDLVIALYQHHLHLTVMVDHITTCDEILPPRHCSCSYSEATSSAVSRPIPTTRTSPTPTASPIPNRLPGFTPYCPSLPFTAPTPKPTEIPTPNPITPVCT